jgi:hypothetical protein
MRSRSRRRAPQRRTRAGRGRVGQTTAAAARDDIAHAPSRPHGEGRGRMPSQSNADGEHQQHLEAHAPHLEVVAGAREVPCAPRAEASEAEESHTGEEVAGDEQGHAVLGSLLPTNDRSCAATPAKHRRDRRRPARARALRHGGRGHECARPRIERDVESPRAPPRKAPRARARAGPT